MQMLSRRTAMLSLLAVLGAGADAQAGSLRGRYFVVVWGYEGTGPSESHTFAAFYRGDGLDAGNDHPATISWLPASGVVRLFGSEKGRNLSLGETRALARKHHYRVASYGPYEISAETYSHALGRIRLLNSGRIAYTMVNVTSDAMNCIQAAGSINGPIVAGLRYGFAASAAVARHLALNPGHVDRDAAARLHLGRSAAAQ